MYWAVRDFARDYDLTTSNAVRFMCAAMTGVICGKGWIEASELIANLLPVQLREEWQKTVEKAVGGGANRQVPWD